MTDRIEPALTAAEFRNEGMDDPSILGDIRYVENPRHLAKIIALANAALPDTDPRKITREWIGDIRDVAQVNAEDYRVYKPGRDEERAFVERLFAIAAALESYLPPE